MRPDGEDDTEVRPQLNNRRRLSPASVERFTQRAFTKHSASFALDHAFRHCKRGEAACFETIEYHRGESIEIFRSAKERRHLFSFLMDK